jgi:hypothetical protein
VWDNVSVPWRAGASLEWRCLTQPDSVTLFSPNTYLFLDLRIASRSVLEENTIIQLTFVDRDCCEY